MPTYVPNTTKTKTERRAAPSPCAEGAGVEGASTGAAADMAPLVSHASVIYAMLWEKLAVIVGWAKREARAHRIYLFERLWWARRPLAGLAHPTSVFAALHLHQRHLRHGAAARRR